MSKSLIPTSMSKLTRDPFCGLFPRDFKTLWREFDNLFQDLPGFVEDGWSLKEFPRSDVIYDNNKTIVELPLAGYTKEQLSVEVREGHLVISATKCSSKDCSRRAARAFQRTLWIGDGHQLDKLSASFKDGLLKIEIPLTAPREPETIKVAIQ